MHLETACSSTFTLYFLLALRQNLCTDYIIYFRDNLCEKTKSASISGAQLKLSLLLYFCRKGTRVLDLAVIERLGHVRVSNETTTAPPPHPL
jgi:hypothetical protein